jgi:hypothetical protein
MSPKPAFIGLLRATKKARHKRQAALDRQRDWDYYQAQCKKYGPYLHASVYQRKKA